MANYHFAFQITRKIVFEVEYYTLANNPRPYFTTSAAEFNQPKTDFQICGQCQRDLLTGKTKVFHNTFDQYHLEDLTTEQWQQILAAITELKATYNFVESDKTISFTQLRSLSMTELRRKTNENRNQAPSATL